MRERTEDGSHDKQDEDDNSHKIAEDDRGPTTPSQGTIGDPDGEKRVSGGKSITNSWILVLYETTA